MSDEEDEEGASYGWDAIDSAMSAVYGDQEPKHYRVLIPYSLGGPDPLTGISAYRSEKGGPHWHFVTYGFSELYDKDGDDAEHSGYGFELTMRVPSQPNEEEPPMWVANFLQNIAKYVFGSGNVFRIGDYMDANGPIYLDSDTKLTALLFAVDPDLGMIETPNGKVQFEQVLGITASELVAVKTWNTAAFTQLLKRDNPMLMSDLARACVMTQPDVVTAVKEGVARDGSSTGMLFVGQLQSKISGFPFSSLNLTLGGIAVAELKVMLPARLDHNKPLLLLGPETKLTISRADKTSWSRSDEGFELMLSSVDTKALLENLRAQPGTYEPIKRLKVTVE